MNPHPTVIDVKEVPTEYQEFCVALVSPPREKSLQELDIIHMVYGIVGEIIEFRNTCESNPLSIPNYRQELLKEAGDILYYLTAYGFKTNNYLYLNPLTEDVSDQFFLRLFKQVDKFFDLNKKKYFYNNDDSELNVKITVAFQDLCSTTTLMLHSFFTYKEIIDANIEKLDARYKGRKFSLAASIARADEATTT